MSPTPLRVDGVDISHHNPDPNLERAKQAGVKWMFHKATEGDGFKDPEYATRREQARKASFPFGAYHFARPDIGDADDEARFFLSVAKPVPGDLAPMLDLETTEGLSQAELRTWARNFSRVIQRRCGVLPLLYCPWDLDLPNVRWVPRYNDRNEPPRIPWDVWQFSNGQLGVPDSVPGFGRVDLNHSKVAVQKLRVPAPEPVPTGVELHLHHASAAWPDSDAQSLADYRAALKRGAHVTTFTETSKANGNLALLRKAAKETGHQVFWFGGGQALAVPNGVKVLDSGGELVNKPDAGDPPAGGHSARYASWVRIELGGEDIFVVTAHWVTGYGNDPSRVVKHHKMSEAIVRLVEENAGGARLAFWTGDINASDVKQDGARPAWRILEEGDLTSCWDELGVWPSTHGSFGKKGGTIDIIGSYDADVRVSADRFMRYKERFSDHIPISVWYDIAPRRKRG